MTTIVPFDDGRRFVIGVRVLIPVVAVIAGIAGAVASNAAPNDESSFAFPHLIYFSVRAALVGYGAGFFAAILAIVASRWSRLASGVAAATGVGVPFIAFTLFSQHPDDYLGVISPMWFSLIMAAGAGIGVALLPPPTLRIEWATIIGRSKYLLLTRPIEGELTAEMAELSQRLDEWDPIGVYDFMSADQWPHGEYDDLIEPILEALRAGAKPQELARELVSVLKNDYGLGVTLADTEPVAASLVQWYADSLATRR
jgi:hypothetical protein